MATMNGKTPDELLASHAKADEWMGARLGLDAMNEKPDQYAGLIRKQMEEYPTVEEYAAHRANSIYVFGLDQGVFTEPEAGHWARELGEILRSPERLAQCEERFLSGRELDAARRERRHAVRRLAIDQARKERIAQAAHNFRAPEFDNYRPSSPH